MSRIKLHRKIESREWYNDIPTKVLFLHLLIKCNHKETKRKGITIKPGQRVTSLGHLSSETGLSVRQIRTSINKLKSTSEMTIKTTNKFSVITLTNWAVYQSSLEEETSKTTSNVTNERQTNDNKQEGIERKEEKKEEKISFDVFRDSYKKKVGDKKKCLAKRNKLSLEEQEKILGSLPAFLASIRDRQFQPYPETYLNARRWEDETVVEELSDELLLKRQQERGSQYIIDTYGKETYHRRKKLAINKSFRSLTGN